MRQPMVLLEAASGAEALEVLRQTPDIGCVLLDFFLPDADAKQLIPSLLKAHPHLPIVALTGLGDEAIAVALMKAGARDYLTKDALDAQRLTAAIRSAVAQCAAERRAASLELLQRRHAQRLEQLMVAAQHLVGTHDLADLADHAITTACDVLQCSAAYVRITAGDEAVDASEGAAATVERSFGPAILAREPTSSSSAILRAPGETSRPHRVHDGGDVVLTMWLSPADRRGHRSVFAVRVPARPDVMALDEALFHQLGALLTRSIESSRLMASVRRAVTARDNVLAVVSHDLRGPLGSALLGCGLLSDDADASGRAVLGRMERSLRHMQRLVEDLVLAMKAEQGRIALKLSRVDVTELLHEVKAMAEDAAADVGVSITVEPPPATTPALQIEADALRLVQVLQNIINNGLKFTPAGGMVSLAARSTDEGVILTVTDTGAGMSEEQRARVFDRYYTDDRRDRGLGLGLAIAQGIVQRHGGDIGVESEPGAGSRFWIRLPWRVPNHERPTSAAEKEGP